MPENKDSLLEQLKISTVYRRNLRQIITSLSLVVVLIVFWSLKLTGIGIAGEAFCGMQEHIHSNECHFNTLICTQETTGSHVHDETCFVKELICQRQEDETHTHDASCWAVTSDPVCGKEPANIHQHTDECYKITESCLLEEHIHTENCYSDITADIETCEDWEKPLADMVHGPTVRENLILVAKTQLDYKESTLNFQVDALGVRRGITRYGQWYGNPYGDWSAMFTLFCLHYAGAEDIPMNAGPEALRLEWEKVELYEPAVENAPEIGNLIFLHHKKDISAESTVPTEETIVPTESNTDAEKNAPPPANAVAIIADIDEKYITVIEGNVEDAVVETKYELDDEAIIGYGIVPELKLTVTPPEETEPTVVPATTETVPSDETVPSSETAPSDETLPSNETLPSDETPPPPEVDPSDATEPPPETVPSDKTDADKEQSPSDNTLQTTGSPPMMLAPLPNNLAAAPEAVPAAVNYTIWFDGTDGGLGHLTGSPNTAQTVADGSIITLPAEWTSPTKYSYKLRGWYDVNNSKYYPAGSQMEVTGNAVLYADWVAATYDLGEFNAQVANTVSTNSFITTYMFDYNYLFNVQSSNVQVTINNTRSHSETWSMVTSGNVKYDNAPTLDFIFAEADGGGKLSNPNNRSNRNRYQSADTILNCPSLYGLHKKVP